MLQLKDVEHQILYKKLRGRMRHVIQHCVCRGLSAAETNNEMKLIYSENCYFDHQMEWWHKEFHKGHISVELTPHGSWPKTSCSEVNVNSVIVIIRENRYISLRNVALHVNSVLKDHLHMCRVSSMQVHTKVYRKTRCVHSRYKQNVTCNDDITRCI